MPALKSGDWKVADLNLAPFGRKEIQLAEHEMPGLMSLRRQYGDAKPLAGAQLDQGLDEHRGLHGHVQRPGDASAGEGLRFAVLAA